MKSIDPLSPVHSTRPIALLASIALLLLSTPSPAEAGQDGFGMRRALVEISRVQPASVPIPGSTIAVRGESQDPDCQPLASHLAAQLESELLNADPRLSSDDRGADVVLDATVLRCDSEEKWERRRETERRKTGEDSNGDPIYKEYDVTVRYQVLDAQLVVAYEATVRANGTTLDADSIDATFNREYKEGRGSPSLGEAQNGLVDEIVTRIVPRLAPTEEAIRVLLPKGSLKDLIPLAEAGLWNRYLEALERQSPRSDPEDESYRRYAIGLGYEALGYQAAEPEVTLRYLEQAAVEYDQALGLNPSEKYFTEPFEASIPAKAGKGAGRFLLAVVGGESEDLERPDAEAPPPIERVRAALTSYRQVISQKEQLASTTATGGAPGGKSLAGGNGAPAFGNEEVIDMVEAGLEEEIIAQAIEDSDHCTFDLSPQGLIQLSQAAVPGSIIKVMQSAPCTESG